MWFPLIFVALVQIQGGIGAIFNNGHQPVILPVLPATAKICKYDAFMESTPYNGKVFLWPWETTDRRGTWMKNFGFCAAHCAEMVTIHSQEEKKHFLDFMRTSVFDGLGSFGYNTAIWLGAQVNNKTFTSWTKGEPNDYNDPYPGEYIEDGVTCLNIALGVTNDYFFNYYCDWNDYFVACQRPVHWTPNQAPPCFQVNDLVILLDSSGSIGSGPYEKAKKFVNEIAKAYAQSGSRVAVFAFSNVVKKVFSLTDTIDMATMTSKILDAPFINSTTRTDLAINDATAEFASTPRAVPLNLLLITDGQSTNQAATVTATTNAIAAGIRTFSVGVGKNVNQTELIAFANGNEDRVFNADNYDDLLNLLIPVSRKIC